MAFHGPSRLTAPQEARLGAVLPSPSWPLRLSPHETMPCPVTGNETGGLVVLHAANQIATLKIKTLVVNEVRHIIFSP
jgi:hypothetical protein